MNAYFGQKLMLLASQNFNWQTGVVFSCLDSHSDGTHSLQRIYCWASDVKLHSSESVPMERQTHVYLEWSEGETFSAIFNFGVSYSFKTLSIVDRSIGYVFYCILGKNQPANLSSVDHTIWRITHIRKKMCMRSCTLQFNKKKNSEYEL